MMGGVATICASFHKVIVKTEARPTIVLKTRNDLAKCDRGD